MDGGVDYDRRLDGAGAWAVTPHGPARAPCRRGVQARTSDP